MLNLWKPVGGSENKAVNLDFDLGLVRESILSTVTGNWEPRHHRPENAKEIATGRYLDWY